MKLGVAVLAAGSSSRFGSNKLLTDIGGKPMIAYALEAAASVPAEKRCVVTGFREIAQIASEYGFEVIVNDKPQKGQSESVLLCAEAMKDTDALLILVADQPMLTGESLRLLVSLFASSGKGLACLRDESHAGNPAVFSRRYYPDLLALHGDRGAKSILRAHEEDLQVVSCIYPHELSDADTPEQLAHILCP